VFLWSTTDIEKEDEISSCRFAVHNGKVLVVLGHLCVEVAICDDAEAMRQNNVLDIAAPLPEWPMAGTKDRMRVNLSSEARPFSH